MQITIKTVTGRKIDLNVDNDTSVPQPAHSVIRFCRSSRPCRRGKASTPPCSSSSTTASQCNLLFSTHPARSDDNIKMKDLNIQPGAAMHVVLNLK